MKAIELMTANPRCCWASDSAQDVACVMRDYDCGCVPIVDRGLGCIVGIVTDRDLAIRAVAAGKNGDTSAGDLMTPIVHCCGPSDNLRDVEQLMADHQVRRVPVVDADGFCIGIISQADLARAALEDNRVSEHEVAVVVECISEPHLRPAARYESGLESTF